MWLACKPTRQNRLCTIAGLDFARPPESLYARTDLGSARPALTVTERSRAVTERSRAVTERSRGVNFLRKNRCPSEAEGPSGDVLRAILSSYKSEALKTLVFPKYDIHEKVLPFLL
jgi:hypothetical protein